MNQQLSQRAAFALFATVIFAWGFNWTVVKLTLQHMTPLWMIAIRSGLAAVVLLFVMLATGNLRIPKRGDMPVVCSIALLHMTAFAALMAIGIQFVPAGRSIVLGYTTPLWVTPAAVLLLGERLTAARIAGVALGMAGLAVMFNPLAFDWADQRALLGNGLLLLSAFSWAISIIHTRAHQWISTPFQLVFWEVLLATVVLTLLALAIEGRPQFTWSLPLVLLLAYGSVIGVALGYWAIAMVNRSLPAVTTSLGVLATPVVGVLCSMLVLDEPFSLPLLVALAMIIGGIALGTLQKPLRRPAPRQPS
jgi:drug/metabolite transporter (DMT)-like permease